MAWKSSGADGVDSSAGGGGTRGRGRLVVGGLVALLVLWGFVRGGLSGGLSAVGLVVLAVGAWALLRGRLRGVGIASRRAAAGVAAAGFVVTGIGGSLAPAADTEALPDQVAVATTTAPAPTTSRPAPTRPVQAAATTAAPTTTTPSLPPVPVMSMTCPGSGSGASPIYGQQISATGPYQVTINYGDGDVYTNDDQNLAAIFSHRYLSAGTFVVQAVLTDVAGQTATASCTYTWTAPVAPAPAPVVGSTGGGSTGGSGGGGAGGGAPAGGAIYANCSEVKAAGAAPIYPGDPGWQDKFDRDNDGVGCES